jgi:YVTN family beta-propeller protein
MRCFRVVLGITLTCLFFTIGQSQWLEATITVDSGPCALIWNSTNNKVYCTNIYSENVTIIDGVTDSVIATVNVDHGPCALAYNPTNNKVYCANYGLSPYYDSTVTIIDGATNSVITTIGVGYGPCAFTYNPFQNRVYVANYSISTVSVIRDVGGGIEERQTLDAERLTPEIYPNPAKSFLAVRLPLSADRQTIKIFDVSGTMVKEIATFPSVTRNDGLSETKISLKGINPGIYFLRLGKETKKFIVAR